MSISSLAADREVLYYQWTNWLILARSYNAAAVVCTIVWIVNMCLTKDPSEEEGNVPGECGAEGGQQIILQ